MTEQKQLLTDLTRCEKKEKRRYILRLLNKLGKRRRNKGKDYKKIRKWRQG